MASWAADHEGWPTTCAAADESIVPRIKEHPIYRTACGKSSNKCEARGKGSDAEADEEETQDEADCDNGVQDAGELAVDCGGGECIGCPAGTACPTGAACPRGRGRAAAPPGG